MVVVVVVVVVLVVVVVVVVVLVVLSVVVVAVVACIFLSMPSAHLGRRAGTGSLELGSWRPGSIGHRDGMWPAGRHWETRVFTIKSNLSNIGGGYRFSVVFLYIFPWFNSRDDSHHLAQGEAELLLGRRLRPSSAPASSSTMDVNRDPTLQAVRGCGVLGWLHLRYREEVTGRKVVDVPVSN